MATNEVIFSHPSVRIQRTGTGNSSSHASSFTAVSTQSVVYSDGSSNGIPGYGRGSQLAVQIKPNQISWAYSLNSQSFPTYAGEVVQILSAYVDNVTIQGDVRTYSDMELIYKWFIAYMTIATQGLRGAPLLGQEFRYNETPVLMQYPHRGWNMYIRPLSLPSFTYGTDVVVPNWQMEAAVVEDENMQLTQMLNTDIPALVQTGLRNLDGRFGLAVENPFNYWDSSYDPTDVNKFLKGQTPILNDTSSSTQLADWFQNLVAQNSKGDIDISSSNTVYSKPFTAANTSANINSVTQAAGSSSSNPLGSLSPPIFGSSGSPTSTSITAAGTPTGVVQAAQIALSQASNYVYSEQADRGNGGNLYGPYRNPQDCSSFVTLCFKAAGLPDPNGQNYNPIGTTYSLMPNCTKLSSPATPQLGDLYFWDNPAHVALATDSNGGIIEMVGEGLISLTVSQETPNHTVFYGCYRPNVYG